MEEDDAGRSNAINNAGLRTYNGRGSQRGNKQTIGEGRGCKPRSAGSH